MGQKRKLRRSYLHKKKNRTVALRPGSSKYSLPQYLVRAHQAVGHGLAKEAADIMQAENVKIMRELKGSSLTKTNVMFVLAEMFYLNGKYKMAENLCKDILKLGPSALLFNLAAVYNLAGGVCINTGRITEAIQYLKKAIETDPNIPEMWNNLGMELVRAGHIQEGLELLRKSVEKAPANALLDSNYLLYLHYLPSLNPQKLFDEHKRWARLHAPVSRARKSHSNEPDPDRRLRVGYISPDFRMNSAAYNFEAFLDGHNRSKIEVYGYGNIAKADSFTERFKDKFDRYRSIRGVSDAKAAALIEEDKIDILVEIGGHINDNRLPVLAYKPAPIQVDYGGANTSGMEQIDYRLTDSLLETPELQEFYIEESVYLPGGLICYTPPDFAPPVGPLPALRKGYVTFGVFNNSMKINSYSISLWAKILKANSNSRLLMKFAVGDDEGMKNKYWQQFEQFGIGRERVEICGWKPAVEHLKLYGEVDIALDTYPYNGCVTALEGLWMGVGIVSLVGDSSFLSRVGLSMLSRMGLESFAVAEPAEYIAKATSLAKDLKTLAGIRGSLRSRMTGSPLCDAKRFASEVETAYRKMWHRWCQRGNKCSGTEDSKVRI